MWRCFVMGISHRTFASKHNIFGYHFLPAKLAKNDTQKEKSTLLPQAKALTSENPDSIQKDIAMLVKLPLLRSWPAQRVYYLREAFAALNSGLIVSSVWTLYFESMRLSLTQIALIYTVITIAGIVLEVPTGVIADSYSRRLSVILGGLFIGLCYTSMGLFPMFLVALIAAFLESIGDACVSGALEAWITDEVGPEQVGPVFVRAAQISAPMYWIGTALSIGLAALFSYHVPIVLGGLLWFALTILLILTMPETGFVAAQQPGTPHIIAHIQSSIAIFHSALRSAMSNATLLRLCIAGFFVTGMIEFFWRASIQHLLNDFMLPVITLPILGALKKNVWLGMLAILRSTLLLIGMSVLHTMSRLNQQVTLARIMTTLYILMLPALVLFASTQMLAMAIIAILLINLLYDIAQPVIATWLNLSIDSATRATMLSISSQINMLGMLILASAMSVFADNTGLRPAILVASLLLIPVLVMYARGAAEPK